MINVTTMRKMTLLNSLLLSAFLLTATPSSAQGFFNKLKKTVTGAVEGTITATANAMVGDEETIRRREREAKEQEEREKQKAAAGNNGATAQDEKKDEEEGHGPGAGKWGNPPAIKIDFDNFCWECVSQSCDGVITIQVGYNKRYRFYETKGGKRITEKDWMAYEYPLFDKGVCAVKSPETRKWYILRQDGTTLELPSNITAVSNFRDGLAVAEINYEKHFINERGQVVLPNLRLREMHSYPLIDGTRRLFEGADGFGYLDGHNNIVIKSQYLKARNFSGGYAMVFDWTATNNEWWVINELGKKVSVVPEEYVRSNYVEKVLYVTDFVHGGAMASNNATGRYDVVDPQMRVQASFDDASAFCLMRIPSDAAVAVVKNESWEYPEFVKPNGELIRSYADPMVTIAGPTRPYYVRENGKGEKTLMLPPLFANYHHHELPPGQPWLAWKDPAWEYTGYTVLGGSLVTDMGYIMNYQGIVRILNWRYEKYEDFSSDGYAKGLKMSTKNWYKSDNVWKEELEQHMVFMDVKGNVVVEIINQE